MWAFNVSLLLLFLVNGALKMPKRIPEPVRVVRKEEIARYENLLARRAEVENRLWMRGNEHGLYGLPPRFPQRPAYTRAERAERRWNQRWKA